MEFTELFCGKLTWVLISYVTVNVLCTVSDVLHQLISHISTIVHHSTMLQLHPPRPFLTLTPTLTATAGFVTAKYNYRVGHNNVLMQCLHHKLQSAVNLFSVLSQHVHA